MNDIQTDKPVVRMETPTLEPRLLEAEPENLEIDLKRLAVVSVDMLNAFATKGAFHDLLGWDLTEAQKTIEPNRQLKAAARRYGVQVIYVAHRFMPDLSDAGGPDSGHWHKDLSLKLFREHPEWRDKLCMQGTWGSDFVDELTPEEGDIIVEKYRFSGFHGTRLDTVLKGRNIKFLAITGIATNICVESTIRDALYLGYFPILISDAASAAGPEYMQDAVIHNLKICFGWVTDSEKMIAAIGGKS